MDKVDNELEVDTAKVKTLERAFAVGAFDVDAELEELIRRVPRVLEVLV